MRQIVTAAAALVSVFLFSCQKEVNENNGGGGSNNNNNPNLLKKTVEKSGSDSTVVTYTYNSAGKLTNMNTLGSIGGQTFDLKQRFVRNSAGIIQQTIIKSDQFIQFGIDSVVTKVNYDAANNRYKNAITSISLLGFSFKDSLVYQYDASGKLTTEIDYSDDGTGGGYVPSGKTEYVYTGSNLTTQKDYTYDDTSASWDLDETDTYEYDAKTNPVQFVADAPVLGIAGFFSANNATKITAVNADPTKNAVTTETYTYNAANRPATGTSTTNGTASDLTFFY